MPFIRQPTQGGNMCHIFPPFKMKTALSSKENIQLIFVIHHSLFYEIAGNPEFVNTELLLLGEIQG